MKIIRNINNNGIKFLDVPENSTKYKFSDLVYKEGNTYAYSDNFIDDSNWIYKKLINEDIEALLEINRIGF